MTRHEVFWPYSHTAPAVILDSADGEAVVAGARVTIAVGVIDIPVIGIYGGVVHSAKKSIHSTELWSWLSTIAIGHDNPTGHSV